MALNATEKDLLAKVLNVAGGHEGMIDRGIVTALVGTHDRARRTYLWNILKKAARAKIRRNKKQTQ